MKGKKLKSFLISEIIVSFIFIAIIFLVFYFMKNIIWYKTLVVVISIILIYMVVGALNIIANIKK